MRKFLLFLLLVGGAGYFVYTTYLQGGSGGGTGARGLSRMRGNSKEMDEVQNSR